MMNASPIRLLHEGFDHSNSTNSHYPTWRGTNHISELPAFAQVIIISSIVLLSVLSAIPVAAFLYGCFRKERILREAEERRRQRIELILGGAGTRTVDDASPWQRAIRHIPRDQAEDILSRLMHTFTWFEQENKNQDKISENLDEQSDIEEGNADYCAICISHFEDQDEVVQSSINVCVEVTEKKDDDADISNLCVHRFHKSCMIEWLLRSKEPLCPFCRRQYLDRKRMEEEGIIIEDDTQEVAAGEVRTDANADLPAQNEQVIEAVVIEDLSV